MWNLKDNKDIIGVAFIDSKLYIHSVTSIRNFILAADMLQSVTLMQYRVSDQLKRILYRRAANVIVLISQYIWGILCACEVKSRTNYNT